MGTLNTRSEQSSKKCKMNDMSQPNSGKKRRLQSPTATVSCCSDQAGVLHGAIPQPGQHVPQTPQAASISSAASAQNAAPLRNLPDGYQGFYKISVNNDGQERIMSTFATPKRTALDHCYSTNSKKKLAYDSGATAMETTQKCSPKTTCLPLYTTPGADSDMDEDLSDIDVILEKSESEYVPTEDSENSECDSDSDDETDTYPDDTFPDELKQCKFIVFEKNMKQLMKFCKNCGSPVTKCEKSVKKDGACVSFAVECHSGCEYTWSSQPSMGSALIASSIMVTGNTYSKIASFARALKLKFIGKTCYQDYQKKNIIPVVQKAWNEEKKKVVEEMKEKDSLILAGDARCDSPGYNAKFGSYTLMDTEATSGVGSKKKIVSLEVVQVSEVANSNHMEPEGLKRCLNQIKAEGLKPSAIATDRHVMVTAIMKNEYKEINHQFDIWHLVKNILKKLMAKAKLKKCEELSPWIRSITNHMWWCAESCGGDAQLLREKWLSVLNHISNRHHWSGSTLFHKCAHKRLTAAEKKEIQWLDPKSEAFKTLKEIVTETRLLNALPNLTMFCHTGELEVFHSMLLKYCPKRQHFHYEAMKARLFLAALDWNTQTRLELKDEDNNIKESSIFSKRRGTWVKRVRYLRLSENHVPIVMKMIVESIHSATVLPKMAKPDTLPKYVAKVPKPNPADIPRKSRFGK